MLNLAELNSSHRSIISFLTTDYQIIAVSSSQILFDFQKLVHFFNVPVFVKTPQDFCFFRLDLPDTSKTLSDFLFL